MTDKEKELCTVRVYKVFSKVHMSILLNIVCNKKT